jgi:SpoVK/Ycf46/Vps4 family AAA+-type ATPase
LKTNNGLSEFINQVQPIDIYSNAMFAQMISVEEAELINFMLALDAIGLFDSACLQFNDGCSLPPSIISRLTEDKAECYTDLIEPIIRLQPSSLLTLKDFEYLDLTNLQQYLNIAVNHSMVGVNILFYGEAGMGKTELAKALSDTLSSALIAIKPLGDDIHYQSNQFSSKASSSVLRIQYQRLIQNIACNEEKSLLLIDECEDIFEQSISHRGVGKDLIHELLETNLIPSIWITNHIDEIPPSCIRRFTFVKHIQVPDNRILENIVAKTSKGLRLSKQFKSDLAAKENIAPAHIANATLVSLHLNLKSKSAEANILTMVNDTLAASGCDTDTAKYKAQLPFSTEYLNIKGGHGAIKQLQQAIDKQSDIRTLLLGPPGTGKSAMVNHLAEATSQELITVRCSDILDKYVGGSEKNIAKVFKQATATNAILFFDEVDSLLQDRSGLSQGWEIQQVNELLTQMEAFELPLFAATNFDSRLDKAVLRRFDFKLSFEHMTSEQVIKLYKYVTAQSELTRSVTSSLHKLKHLTPGEFAVLTRRQRITSTKLTNDEFLDILTTENNRKLITKTIGFI